MFCITYMVVDVSMTSDARVFGVYQSYMTRTVRYLMVVNLFDNWHINGDIYHKNTKEN